MKVLHVIPAVSPKYGGPSHALPAMCRALMARGVELQIASTDAEPGGRISVELERLTSYQGVPAIFFKKEWSEAFKYSPRLSRWLNGNVSAFDLVHIHGTFSHACLSAAKASRRSAIPYIIRPLGNLEDRSLKQKRLRKKLFLNLGGNRMLRNAAAIHYVCESEKRRSESALDVNHGVVVPLGINNDTMTSHMKLTSSNGRRPYVLVLSRLQPAKGIDVLLKAFLKVRENQKLSDWQLIIAGDGSPHYQSLLKKIIEERNANDAVMLTGWLDGDAKARALAGASLLALPSHHDAFGLCLLEAIARGIPVLVSPHVGLAHEIEAAGAGWVSAVEVEALGRALEEACTNDDERRCRGKASEMLARKFDWDKVAGMLSQLYESIYEGNGRARRA